VTRLGFTARVQVPGEDEPTVVRGTAEVDDAVPESGWRDVVADLIVKLFAPVVIAVIDVIVKHFQH
jgi:hypothetical protein